MKFKEKIIIIEQKNNNRKRNLKNFLKIITFYKYFNVKLSIC